MKLIDQYANDYITQFRQMNPHYDPPEDSIRLLKDTYKHGFTAALVLSGKHASSFFEEIPVAEIKPLRLCPELPKEI